MAESMYAYKQVIVMRTDLNMRKGKMIAQGAHASVRLVVEHGDDQRVYDWLVGGMAKICVRVDSAEDLLELVGRAKAAGLLTSAIMDAGHTEFGGVPTLTCAAIGPDLIERVDSITAQLKLL